MPWMTLHLPQKHSPSPMFPNTELASLQCTCPRQHFHLLLHQKCTRELLFPAEPNPIFKQIKPKTKQNQRQQNKSDQNYFFKKITYAKLNCFQLAPESALRGGGALAKPPLGKAFHNLGSTAEATLPSVSTSNGQQGLL